MSAEQLKGFLNEINTNTELGEKLTEMDSPDAIVALANESGFEITTDELSSEIDTAAELNEDDLDSVVGGSGKTYMKMDSSFGVRLNAKTKISKDTCGDARCHTDSCTGTKSKLRL